VEIQVKGEKWGGRHRYLTEGIIERAQLFREEEDKGKKNSTRKVWEGEHSMGGESTQVEENDEQWGGLSVESVKDNKSRESTKNGGRRGKVFCGFVQQ